MEPSSSDIDFVRPTSHVGDLLRETREKVGEPLVKIAGALRIRPGYLEDIEAGRFDSLPSGAYAVGFVRAYADYLGLHAEEVVRRFKEEGQRVTVAAPLDFPVPSSDGGMPRGTLIFGALIVAACAYGGWYWLSTSDRPVTDLIPDLPDRLNALVNGSGVAEDAAGSPEAAADPTEVVSGEGPETPTATPAADATAPVSPLPTAIDDDPGAPLTPPEPDPVSPLEDAAAPTVNDVTMADTAGDGFSTVAAGASNTDRAPVAVSTVRPVVDPVSAYAAVSPSEPIAPSPIRANEPVPDTRSDTLDNGGDATARQTPEGENAVPPRGGNITADAAEKPRIVLRASRDSWIELRQKNDLLTRKFMRTGDVYIIPEGDGITLTASNAGGLEVYVDDERVPNLGPPGVARDAISMDPNRLRRLPN